MDSEKVPPQRRQLAAEFQTRADTLTELQEDRVGRSHHGGQPSPTPKPQRVQRGFSGCAPYLLPASAGGGAERCRLDHSGAIMANLEHC